MSERVTRDSRSVWQRWEMEALPQRRQAQAEAELQARETSSQAREREQRAREQAREQEQARNAEAEAHQREQARQQARDEGFAQGLAEGREQGIAQGLREGREAAEQELDARLKAALAPLTELAGNFRQALDALDEDVASSLVELALATGHQLAGEALAERPEQVLAIVRELLHVEPAPVGKPRLWLNPGDLALVEEHLGQELAALGWQLQPDDQLQRGGCRVTSTHGELDASWESRWQAVREQVRRRSPRPGSAPS